MGEIACMTKVLETNYFQRHYLSVRFNLQRAGRPIDPLVPRCVWGHSSIHSDVPQNQGREIFGGKKLKYYAIK